jgi:t-SNARE complex subunit (syntaxin)
MAEDAHQTDQSDTLPDTAYIFKLPHVTTLDEVNKNFDDVGGAITLLIHEMRENSEVTNKNLMRLAEETSKNLGKLTADMKSVLSSQTMMLVICFTVIGSVVVIIKTIYDILFGPIV